MPKVRIIHRYATLPALVLALACSAARADCSRLSPALDSILVEHLAELRGTQYCTQTYKSNRRELVVYFVENPCYGAEAAAGSCGRRTLAFLAGIERGSPLKPLKIGASGEFVPGRIRIEGNDVIVSGTAYADADPPCCPSIASEQRVRITPRGFILTTR